MKLRLSNPLGSPRQLYSAKVGPELNGSWPKAEQAMGVVRCPECIGQGVLRQALNMVLSDDQASAALAPLSEPSVEVIAVWRLSALAPLQARATRPDGPRTDQLLFVTALGRSSHLASGLTVLQIVSKRFKMSSTYTPPASSSTRMRPLRSNQATSGPSNPVKTDILHVSLRAIDTRQLNNVAEPWNHPFA